MLNQFKEKRLPRHFCEKTYKEVGQFLQQGLSCTIVGMPSVGVSLFLKYLVTQDAKHFFVYVDTYALASPTQQNLLSALVEKLGGDFSGDTDLRSACLQQLRLLSKKYRNITIVINRFELLEKEFSQNLFGSLRTLPHEFGGKVCFIFATNKLYVASASQALTGGNLDMFSRYCYFKPYKKNDLEALLLLHSPELYVKKILRQEAIRLSGGHFQLLQLILKSEMQKHLLSDPYIQLLFKTINRSLTYSQKVQVRKISFGKIISFVDPYLLHIGLVRKEEKGYTLFCPLFAQFIVGAAGFHLPLKEKKLFTLLKMREGKLVEKEELFAFIWKEEREEATDWALDSLIYRLRKNPLFQQKGYRIESNKKIGYLLLRD